MPILETVMSALLAGLGSGFLVAAQVGPIWLLCMRSVLRGRFVVGFSIGVGAALIDASYAALGVLGGAGILRAEPQLRLALGLVGSRPCPPRCKDHLVRSPHSSGHGERGGDRNACPRLPDRFGRYSVEPIDYRILGRAIRALQF